MAPAEEEIQGGREVGHWGKPPGHRDHGYVPLTRTARDQLSTGSPGRSAPLWQSFRNWTGRLPARDRLSVAVCWRSGGSISLVQTV